MAPIILFTWLLNILFFRVPFFSKNPFYCFKKMENINKNKLLLFSLPILATFFFAFFPFNCQTDAQKHRSYSKLFNKTIGDVLTEVPLVEINRRKMFTTEQNTFSSRPLFVGFNSAEEKDKIDLVKSWKKHRGPAWQFDELADFFPLRVRGEKGEFQLEMEELVEGMEGIFARIQQIEEFDFINNIYFFDGSAGKQLDRHSDLAELVLASNRNTFDYKRCPKIAGIPPVQDTEVNF